MGENVKRWAGECICGKAMFYAPKSDCPMHGTVATHYETLLEAEQKKVSELEQALGESVTLQSHYAGLLNDYDGGKRLQLRTVKAWIARLKATGVIE